MNERDERILTQLKGINQDAGAFVAGILSDDISRDDQIVFALRLVTLAEYIKERADSTVFMVVEGSVVDDCDDLGTEGRADRTGTADDER